MTDSHGFKYLFRYALRCVRHGQRRQFWHYCRMQHALFGIGFVWGDRSRVNFERYLVAKGVLHLWDKHSPRWRKQINKVDHDSQVS